MMTILATELESVAVQLDQMDPYGSGYSREFLHALADVRVMRIAGTDPGLAAALQHALRETPGSLSVLSYQCRRLSRIYANTPDAQVSHLMSRLASNTRNGGTGIQHLDSSSVEQPEQTEKKSVSWRDDMTGAQNLRYYMLSAESLTEQGAVDHCRGHLHASLPAVRRTASAMAFGASDSQRGEVLEFLQQRSRDTDYRRFMHMFRAAAEDRLSSASVGLTIFEANRAYQDNGGDPAALTWNELKRFVPPGSMSGVNAFITQPADYVAALADDMTHPVSDMPEFLWAPVISSRPTVDEGAADWRSAKRQKAGGPEFTDHRPNAMPKGHTRISTATTSSQMIDVTEPELEQPNDRRRFEGMFGDRATLSTSSTADTGVGPSTAGNVSADDFGNAWRKYMKSAPRTSLPVPPIQVGTAPPSLMPMDGTASSMTDIMISPSTDAPPLALEAQPLSSPATAQADESPAGSAASLNLNAEVAPASPLMLLVVEASTDDEASNPVIDPAAPSVS